jgi:hypothetical protein
MFEAKQQWRDLCHLASVEKDPAKLELLFEEIRRLLKQSSVEMTEGRVKFSTPSRLHN